MYYNFFLLWVSSTVCDRTLAKSAQSLFKLWNLVITHWKFCAYRLRGGGGGGWMGLEDFCFVSIKFTWSPHKVVMFWWSRPHWQFIGSHSSTILLKFGWRLLISQSVPPENNVIPKILYPTPSAINFDSVLKSANLIYILYFNTLRSYFVVRTASSY